MSRYSYDELKANAKKIRAELAEGGIVIEKKTRRRPRDKEKIELLYTMAINRLKKYPPLKSEKGIILPYFSFI